MTTADRIKQIREERDLTQTDLAKMCGYKDKSTICKIEASGDKISSRIINRVAKALNVTVVYLMGFEDEVEEEIISNSSFNAKIMMIMNMLTPEAKKKLMSYAQFLYDTERKADSKS